jgi:hypothetical protein
MSTKYPGGLITKTPVTPAGPYQTGAAPGVWTVEQALQYTKQGIWPTQGLTPNYIEDVFNTYLWNGTGGQAGPFVTGIDLLNKGGLLWTKSRSNAYDHYLMDTVRDNGSILTTNNTAAAVSSPACVNFYADGFKDNFSYMGGTQQVSWSIREQAKFFDVVTYTGDGTGGQTVAHNLTSQPGFILIKRTDNISNWVSLARSDASNYTLLYMNLTNATAEAPIPQTSAASSTNLNVGYISTKAGVNTNGATYVAYLFAHNAGGFGLTGTDNVISCGSFTTDASGLATVSLGYEPQWVLIKRSSGIGGWNLLDTMRGMAATPGTSNTAALFANLSDAEIAGFNNVFPTSTGLYVGGLSTSSTYIYIAIRRGPMKVPTDATTVFKSIARTGTNANATISGVGFSPDLTLGMTSSGSNQSGFVDRLRGINPTAFLQSTTTGPEYSLSTATNLGVTSLTMDGVTVDADQTFGYVNFSTRSYSTHFFKRAPGFFYEICYTGTGSATTFAHNLSVKPELIIQRSRNNADAWYVFAAQNGFGTLNNTSAWGGTGNGSGTNTIWQATSTTIALNSTLAPSFATSGWTYVVYMFATLSGVSKVGTYTGNGTTQTINCGFAAGARFVLIKRTDSTGDWYVYDTARGMTTLTDPYLLLNSTAAETATLGSVTTVTTGFAVNAAILAAINTNAASYIFLAIA